ncbi:MAG TPA: hypothetical protein DIV86_06860 [Alphaproteobacteria bacterium]|nr:hypothetical protein [Alphaproteobacteria bacterium]
MKKKLKIAWFTPFCSKSAIGAYSNIICTELSKYAEVSVFVNSDELKGDVIIDSDNIVEYYSPDEVETINLSRFDRVIYNLGNNYKYHGTIFDISQRISGIIILHDINMHHFFHGYFIEKYGSLDYYKHLVENFYGNCIDDYNQNRVNEDSFWDSEHAVAKGLNPPAIKNALGIIVHSKYHEKILKDIKTAPVNVIHFPSVKEIVEKQQKQVKSNFNSTRVTILTTGHVNSNKKVDFVINAFLQSKILRNKAQYLILGEYNEESGYYLSLKKLIEDNKLQSRIKFLGRKDDEDFFSYLFGTDIYANFRYPNFEGSSWSLLEQLTIGKPILAFNTGCYEEIPEDVIHKIDGYDVEKLVEKLEELVLDAEKRKSSEKKAKEFAEEFFSTKKYVNTLLGFISEVNNFEPLVSTTDKVIKIAREIELLPNSTTTTEIKNKTSLLREKEICQTGKKINVY